MCKLKKKLLLPPFTKICKKPLWTRWVKLETVKIVAHNYSIPPQFLIDRKEMISADL